MQSSHRLTCFLAALAAVGFVTALAPQRAEAEQNEDLPRVAVVETPVVVVQGVGRLSVSTERVTISVHAGVEDSTLRGTLEALHEELERIRAAIVATGADDLEIDESSQRLNERMSYTREAEQRAQQFSASGGFQITAPTLDRAAEVFESLQASGLRVYGPDYARIDRDTHRSEAYKLASADARRKAEQIAAASEMRIGRLVRIEPGSLHVGEVAHPINAHSGGTRRHGRAADSVVDSFTRLKSLNELFGPPEGTVMANATYTFELLESD